MAPTRIAIVHYSVQGHVRKMAQSVLEGINSLEGCEGTIYRVAETLPPEILEKIKPELPAFDGLIFGIPTRFGMMPAQMKALWDATGPLWASGALVGKPVAAFTSVSTQGGGIETTIMTALTQFVHHGMIFVPCGYSYGAPMFNLDEVKAGSPWGAATYAGPTGERWPTEMELGYARHQGQYFAGVVKRLALSK
ncbi:hypothetical protein ABPG77_001257 [Micractinium sp. CCAP 211/92]